MTIVRTDTSDEKDRVGAEQYYLIHGSAIAFGKLRHRRRRRESRLATGRPAQRLGGRR